MKILSKRHHYWGIFSKCLFGVGAILTILIYTINLSFEFGLFSFIAGSISSLIDKYIKKITIIEYDSGDWKIGGEDKYVITIPEETHKLGKYPSVECRIVKNGIESNLYTNIKTDSHGSTIYVNSLNNEIKIRVILKNN